MDPRREYGTDEPGRLSDLGLVLPSKTSDRGRMGATRRRMALMTALIGLATFVMPWVSTDTKVLGRTHWSPLQVLIALHAHRLPVQPQPSKVAYSVFMGVYLVLGLGTAYLILIVIAAGMLISPSARFVGSAAALGAAATVSNIWWRYPDLQNAIYGAPSPFASGHHVYAGGNDLILLLALGALMWIAAAKELD